MKLVPRVLVVLSTVAVALLGLLIPAGPASAQTVQVHAFAMTSHPFSDPVWFPVAHPQKMGCMWNNKDCPPPQIQKYWAWDIMAEREHKGQFHQKVYAMGAGIVHIQFRHRGCGGSHEARGNVLWINHGGGVVSTYLHLADHFLVHDGDYVSARTPIAYVGNSGYKLCHQKPYERFLAVTVQHEARVIHRNTVIGSNMQVKTTYSCVNGQKVAWPQQMPGHTGHQGWKRWYDVPVGTPIPHTSGDRGCIPAPATANMPRNPRLSRGSSSGLAATWDSAVPSFQVNTVRVMLQEYHPNISRWLTNVLRLDPGDATRTYFSGLNPRHRYRLKLWFYNPVGWSKATPWLERGFPS